MIPASFPTQQCAIQLLSILHVEIRAVGSTACTGYFVGLPSCEKPKYGIIVLLVGCLEDCVVSIGRCLSPLPVLQACYFEFGGSTRTRPKVFIWWVGRQDI